MKHEILTEKFGPLGAVMAEAVQTCVHCGFCLPACPTYAVLGQEMDTPRGRIVLMKEALEGRSAIDSVLPHIDRCLGCLGCETACPSGVKYRNLISPFRQMVQETRRPGLLQKLRRRALLETLPHPGRFRWAARLGMLAKPMASLAPRPLRAMLDLLPDALPPAAELPALTPAQGPRRARVALLAGCAQQVLAPEINYATLAVLSRNGVEVVIPHAQGCCGALAWHVGAGETARTQARKNLSAFPGDVDAILTNAAGCGSGLHEYPLMLKGQPEEAQAQAFAERVQDVSVFLDALGIAPPPVPSRDICVAYHDACHLSHAQGVRSAPRRLLRQIPRLELREIPDAELCCGSAGSYNIDQPAIAAELGRRKADAILSTGAEFLAAGNIGCLTQISAHLRRSPRPVRVLHLVELLNLAYQSRL
jgi:glycolate oxidase iron-sulfur subunit